MSLPDEIKTKEPTLNTNFEEDSKDLDPKELEAIEFSPKEYSSSSSGDGDSRLIHHFVPITTYEGYHRYDPGATWSKEEEEKIVRKVDIRILIWVLIMFFALQLDRGNISNANSDNFLKDIGITTNDYNNGMTIFYCSFLFMELPSQIISKRVGVDRWIPVQMMAWSIVAACQCKIYNKTTYYITRFLLGALEGGFIPDIILYLSYFYKREELPIRLSFFWSALQMTTVIGGFLAYGILHLEGVHGWEGWRYLFLIEGCITATIGFLSLLWLPPSPTQTKGGLRGKKGWFNEREEVIMVNRIIRDDPSKGGMHNRQGLDWRMFKDSLLDYDHWGLYLLGLGVFIPPAPPASYLTLTLRSLGYSTFKTNLLTIPYAVIMIINMIILARVSRYFKERTFVSSISTIWVLIFLITLVSLPDDVDPWKRYAVLTLLLGYPYCHPILVAWNSANSNSVRTRTVSASLYNMMVQLGSVIATQIYRTKDAPYYHTGNRALIGISCFNLVVFVLVKLYYIKRNAWKAKKWNAMTIEEKDRYLAETKDQGNKRLDFQFFH